MAFNLVMMGAAALLLSGCQQGGRVEVSGGVNDLRFSIVDVEGRRPLCADSLSVVPAAPDDAEPVWRVISVDPEKCADQLRYGSAGDDFAEEVRSVALRPGVVYRVRASGAGFTAVRDFRVTTDGVVQEQP